MATSEEKSDTRSLADQGIQKNDPRGMAEGIVTRDKDAVKHPKLTVRAVPVSGFIRSGIRFSHKENTVIPANSLNEVRLQRILDENLLVVVEG